MLERAWQDLWIGLFVLLIAIGVFAGQGLVIGLGAMGLVVAGISRVWSRLSLDEVTYTRRLSQQRVFIGEELTLAVTLTNRKPLPLGRVRVEDDLPESLEVSDAEMGASASPNTRTLLHRTSMSWYERIRWAYKVRPTERGLYHLGPANLRSGDLFGFFSSEAHVPERDILLVYPRVLPLPELGIPALRPLGESRGGMRIFQDPARPSGIREYRRGDPLKTVDWKATARMQRMQVRTFEPSSAMTMVVAVGIETTARYWEGYSPVNLERVITTAASVATHAFESRHMLGLFSNGTPILSDRPMDVAPSRAPDQLTVVLEALATIRPMARGPMSARLMEHARRFPMGTTIVLVAALILRELVDTLSSLKAQGFELAVIYVGDEECPRLPEGVAVHDLREHFARMELAGEFGPA